MDPYGYVHAFKNSDFARMVDEMPSDVMNDLANEIHPLFGRDKFKNLTDAEYKRLEPALRLASRMFLNDRMAYFIDTLSAGTLHALNDRGEEVYEELDTSSLSDDNVLLNRRSTLPPPPLDGKITAALRRRASEVPKALTGTLDGIYISAPGVQGSATSMTDIATTQENLLAFPHAPKQACKITLSFETTWGLIKIPRSTAADLVNHFLLACTLAHEVGHLLSAACNGWRHAEVFYNNDCCNESGFSLDMALFGGSYYAVSLDDYLGDPTFGSETAIIRVESPTQCMVDDSNSVPGVQNISQRWALGKHEYITCIPFQFVCSMFTEDFWTHDVPKMESTPIQPFQMCRWIFQHVEPGESYMDDSRITVVSALDASVPCTLRDIELPLKVHDQLRRIRQEELKNASKVMQASHKQSTALDQLLDSISTPPDDATEEETRSIRTQHLNDIRLKR